MHSLTSRLPRETMSNTRFKHNREHERCQESLRDVCVRNLESVYLLRGKCRQHATCWWCHDWSTVRSTTTLMLTIDVLRRPIRPFAYRNFSRDQRWIVFDLWSAHSVYSGCLSRWHRTVGTVCCHVFYLIKMTSTRPRSTHTVPCRPGCFQSPTITVISLSFFVFFLSAIVWS